MEGGLKQQINPQFMKHMYRVVHHSIETSHAPVVLVTVLLDQQVSVSQHTLQPRSSFLPLHFQSAGIAHPWRGIQREDSTH